MSIRDVARRLESKKRFERPGQLWLRTHGAAERRLAVSLESFFTVQAERVAEALRDMGALNHGAVDIALNLDDELAILEKITRRHLLPIMAHGAATEVQAILPSKSFDYEEILDDEVLLDLPQSVRQAVARHFVELSQQSYWAKTIRSVRDNLIQAIQEGVGDGKPLRDIIANIEGLLKENAKGRAKRIARTETTGALNAGHHSAREGLAAEGLILTKVWLAVGDARARIDHAALNNAEVAADAEFTVGSEKAPYPGHYSLSGHQRVNCRCVVVTGKTFAD